MAKNKTTPADLKPAIDPVIAAGLAPKEKKPRAKRGSKKTDLATLLAKADKNFDGSITKMLEALLKDTAKIRTLVIGVTLEPGYCSPEDHEVQADGCGYVLGLSRPAQHHGVTTAHLNGDANSMVAAVEEAGEIGQAVSDDTVGLAQRIAAQISFNRPRGLFG